MKNAGIYPVGHDPDGIILQETLPDKVCQPLGGDLQGKVFNTGKERLLPQIVLSTGIQKGLGIYVFLRAAATAGFPLFAAHCGKIGTVPGEGPAVVQGPDDLLPAAAQIIKQKSYVNIVPVQIVQPDHIRVIFPDLPEKTGCGCPGAEAAGAEDAVAEGVKPVVPGTSDGYGGHSALCSLPPIGDAAGVALLLQPLTGGQNDSAGAAEAGDGIDKQIFHVSSLPRSSRKRRTYWAVQMSGVYLRR